MLLAIALVVVVIIVSVSTHLLDRGLPWGQFAPVGFAMLVAVAGCMVIGCVLGVVVGLTDVPAWALPWAPGFSCRRST
jgi:hypothetical protein